MSAFDAASFPEAKLEAAPRSSEQARRCRICYETYDDEFELGEDGSLAAASIDDEYCLSDVMPGCQIYLSKQSPAEYTRLAQADPSLTARALYLERTRRHNRPAAGKAQAQEEGQEEEQEEHGGGPAAADPPSAFFVFPGLEAGATYHVWVEEPTEEDEQGSEAARVAAQCAKLGDRVVPHHIGGGSAQEGGCCGRDGEGFDEPYGEYSAGGGLPEVWGGRSEDAPNDDAQAHALATGRGGTGDHAPSPQAQPQAQVPFSSSSAVGMKTWA